MKGVFVFFLLFGITLEAFLVSFILSRCLKPRVKIFFQWILPIHLWIEQVRILQANALVVSRFQSKVSLVVFL